MSMLDKVQSHPRAAIIVSLLVVVVCGYAAFRSLRGNEPLNVPTDVAFFDESTGEFSRRPATLVPPLAGADGKPTIVRAVLTAEPASVDHVAYFFRYTAEAQSTLEQSARTDKGKFDLVLMHDDLGKEVRRPASGSRWVSAESDEGRKITAGE